MAKNIILLLLSIATFVIACNTAETLPIAGTWKAVAFSEKGVPAKSEWLPEVWFKFNENGTYEYHSTLKYKEAGTYRLRGNGLYTKDTLTAGAAEKTVKVLNLTNDSLHLEMQSQGVLQNLKLVKK